MLLTATAMLDKLLTLSVLSLAVSSISMTVTKAKFFAPLRELITRRSAWFGELFTCPYCMSHWVGLLAVAAFRPVLVSSGIYLLDLFVSMMAIVTVASWCSGLIYRALSAIPGPSTQPD